jgi:hypothetical protein
MIASILSRETGFAKYTQKKQDVVIFAEFQPTSISTLGEIGTNWDFVRDRDILFEAEKRNFLGFYTVDKGAL